MTNHGSIAEQTQGDTRSSHGKETSRFALHSVLVASALLVLAVMIWQAFTSGGSPDPTAAQEGSTTAVLNVGVLVFREGLECVLVLSAITAGMASRESHVRAVAAGAAIAFIATLITWQIAVAIINDLGNSIPALELQAGTGLLAIIVLLIIMNWFFHKMYWTGWISLHTQKKHELLAAEVDHGASTRLLWGMALLGFTSLYREGFEVVLFLQSYRLRLGGTAVLYGVCVGLILTTIVAALTFVAHRRLPYRKMLVLTGVLLGGVLLVMVGEQAQEMQLARWLPTTPIPKLAHSIPPWMGLWFSVFPTVETLSAQVIAAVIVVGSYFTARK
ncbi:MAG: FTR1 family protein [Bryobacteraceae bacterium]|nr:FTR1 family protein [Bryobacteraceae bacterium]